MEEDGDGDGRSAAVADGTTTEGAVGAAAVGVGAVAEAAAGSAVFPAAAADVPAAAGLPEVGKKKNSPRMTRMIRIYTDNDQDSI